MNKKKQKSRARRSTESASELTGKTPGTPRADKQDAGHATQPNQQAS
jgi:hypothetical protein